MRLPIESDLGRVLGPAGFVKHGRTWRRTTDAAIHVVNLQSERGAVVFVNLGVYLRGLGNDKRPPENHCHVRCRLERVVPESAFAAVRAAVPTAPAPPGLVEALVAYGLPWLERTSTLEGVRELIASGRTFNGFVHKDTARWSGGHCAVN